MNVLFNLAIAGGLLGLLLVALEVGYRRGRRAIQLHDVPSSAQIGAVQGAILGMLGLLLAFSFSAAGGRFLERQDLIVAEANAIETVWRRAELLDEPARSELRSAVKEYTAHRIAVTRERAQQGDQLGEQLGERDEAEIARLHGRIWHSAVAGVTQRPQAMVAVLNPVDEMLDLHATRLYARRKHIPVLVLGLLISSSVLALGVIGYGCGVAGRRSAAMTVPLSIVIGVALWVTIDLDYPRRGLLQLSDAPLEALRFDGVPER